jgi:exoribonuclease-2
MDLERCIITYLAGNEVHLGVVVRSGNDRLQVKGENERSERVTPKHLLANHGSLAGDETAAMQTVRGRIETARGELDLELLWETLLDSGDVSETSCADLAREYFGGERPEQTAAMALALIDDPVHFQRRGLLFQPRSREEAAEILELRAKRAEKALLREAEEAWLGEVLRAGSGSPVAVPEQFEPFIRKCLDFLLLGSSSDAVALLAAANSKETPRKVALTVLEKTGSLPEGADPFLLENGIHAGFSQAVLAAAEAIEPYQADPRRQDLSALPAFSIDDEDTREVDDALSVSWEGDETVVGIHISDPAFFVHKDDPLDRVAAERPLTLYLPTTTVTMLPERIGCDLASLEAGVLRPSLSFTVRFAPDGEIVDWSFGGAQVKVHYRLSYDEADALLADGNGHEVAPALKALVPLVEHLRAQRLAAGGFELNRPEWKVHVSNGEISVKHIPPSTASRQLVSELMILANRLTAEYALRNDIPIIYRVQDPPSQAVKTLTEYDPISFMNEVRKIKRTRLSTHPQPHTGLGLDLYTQISSPIRRYADLVIQRQVAAHVDGEPFPYTLEELFEVVGTVDRTAFQNRGLEREENRHWLLEYAKRNLLDEPHTAIVVQQNGRMLFAELDVIGERGLLHTRQPVKIGDRVTVRIKDIRPKRSEFILETV